MSPRKHHKTNNHFAKAFHASRLQPLHLIDLDKLEEELQDELDWLDYEKVEAPRRRLSYRQRDEYAA